MNFAWMASATVWLTWHAASGPYLFDSGELVAAAWQLGGSHPPGQPLHALLGHAVCWLPLGPLSLRIALLSVVGEIVASYYAGQITARLLRGEDAPAAATAWAPTATAVATLLTGPLLRQATRPEVYGLSLALTLYAIAALLDYAGRLSSTAATARRRHGWDGDLTRAVIAGALVSGLHAPHALVIGVAGFAALCGGGRRCRASSQLWLGSIGIGIITVALVQAYLPIRDRAGAALWGDTGSLAGLWAYLSASAYRSNLSTLNNGGWQNIVDTLLYLSRTTGWWPWIGLTAWLLSSRQHRQAPSLPRHSAAILVAAGLGSLLAASLQALQIGNPDNVAYAGPAAALLIAVGMAGLMVRGASRLPAAAVLGLIGIAALHPWSWSEWRRAVDARAPGLDRLGTALSEAPPPRALVIVESDFAASTWMAAQALEAARPDVALLISGLSTSSWHWRSLRHHPLFPGVPPPGAGVNSYQRYTQGAIDVATRRIDVLSEADAPLAGRGTVRGPYLQRHAAIGAAPALPVGALADNSDSAAERLTRATIVLIDQSPPGDSGNAEAILRWVAMTRATRWAQRRRLDEALRELRPTLFWLPLPQRPLVQAPRDKMAAWQGTLAATAAPQLPFLARDPQAPLSTREDAVRLAANLLWMGGSPTSATQLLAAQQQRNDPRALLQLAWLQAQTGSTAAARAALQALTQNAPQLADEARPLQRVLDRQRLPPTPPPN